MKDFTPTTGIVLSSAVAGGGWGIEIDAAGFAAGVAGVREDDPGGTVFEELVVEGVKFRKRKTSSFKIRPP